MLAMRDDSQEGVDVRRDGSRAGMTLALSDTLKRAPIT